MQEIARTHPESEGEVVGVLAPDDGPHAPHQRRRQQEHLHLPVQHLRLLLKAEEDNGGWTRIQISIQILHAFFWRTSKISSFYVNDLQKRCKFWQRGIQSRLGLWAASDIWEVD